MQADDRAVHKCTNLPWAGSGEGAAALPCVDVSQAWLLVGVGAGHAGPTALMQQMVGQQGCLS